MQGPRTGNGLLGARSDGLVDALVAVLEEVPHLFGSLHGERLEEAAACAPSGMQAGTGLLQYKGVAGYVDDGLGGGVGVRVVSMECCPVEGWGGGDGVAAGEVRWLCRGGVGLCWRRFAAVRWRYGRSSGALEVRGADRIPRAQSPGVASGAGPLGLAPLGDDGLGVLVRAGEAGRPGSRMSAPARPDRGRSWCDGSGLAPPALPPPDPWR